MKKKWKLLQVSEIDPQGEQGQDPAQDAKKFHKSAGTNIKARALRELSDPNIVVALGGGNQYVHSTEAYFRQGLNTAIKRMRLHLEALVQEQQAKMKSLIAQIDAEWDSKLTAAFGADTFKSFAEFKKFWDAQIVHNPNPNDFMRKMQHLVELKKVKTLIGALEHKKNQITKTLAAGGRSSADQKKMEKALSVFGVDVDLVNRGGQDIFQYSGASTLWKQVMEESTQKVIDQVFDSDKGLLMYISDSVNQIFEDFKAGKTSKVDINHAAIGNLFEALSEGFYKDILKHPKTNQVFDMQITREAQELATNKGKYGREHKADSKVALLADGEVVLEFFTSDKTGQGLDWQQVSNDKSVNLNTRMIDQFTASINSSTLDFSQFKIDNVESFNTNKEEINNLINYVIANGFAFAGRVSIVQFKELLVLYAAWLKIIMEVVGDVDISQTPLAIRTLNGIYSTADVLRLFVDIAPEQMHSYLNNQMFSSFYKSDTKLSNRLKNVLLLSKHKALSDTRVNMSYLELKAYDQVQAGSLVPSVANVLQRINVSVSQNWPAMKGSYLIKLNNLKTRR